MSFARRKEAGNLLAIGTPAARRPTPSSTQFRVLILAEVVDFVSRQTKARVIYEADEPAGLIATSEEEMDRLAEFIDQAKAKEPKFHYQRNTVYLRFCHTDYHKGAALEELSRLTEIPHAAIFAAGDHHNDLSMLDGRYAGLPACPANAIAEVKEAVRRAGGWVAEKEFGAGVHEALQHFLEVDPSWRDACPYLSSRPGAARRGTSHWQSDRTRARNVACNSEVPSLSSQLGMTEKEAKS